MRRTNIAAAVSVIACLPLATVSAQEPGLHVFNFAVDVGSTGMRVPIEAKLVKGAPYSAEIVTESIQWLADGNRIAQRSNARVYRDSAGRIRREEDRPAGTSIISISDPVAGASFSLNPEKRLALQTPNAASVHVMHALHDDVRALVTRLPPGAAKTVEGAFAARQADPGAAVVYTPSTEAAVTNDRQAVETLPARDIEGIRAEGVRRTTTIPAGEIGNDLPIVIVSEEWFSPELQVLLLTERTDPRVGTATYRLQNINRTEPASYLFEVPSDYTLKQTGMFYKGEPVRVK